jgi:hypothetical protein
MTGSRGRHPHEQGERSEVVAAFSRLTDAVAWMGASPVSLLLVPVVLDAELDTGTDLARDAKKGEA